MRRPQFQAAHAGVLAAVLSFATVTALSADDVTSIGVIKNENGKFVFTNPYVTVEEGQTVRWVAVEEAGVHQLVPDTDADAMSETDTFDSTNTVSQTFATAGTINYHCSVHPKSMRGTITVTAAKAQEDAAEAPAVETNAPKKAKPKAKSSYGSYGYSY